MRKTDDCRYPGLPRALVRALRGCTAVRLHIRIGPRGVCVGLGLDPAYATMRRATDFHGRIPNSPQSYAEQMTSDDLTVREDAESDPVEPAP
jgi:hypothetical protein